MTVPPTLQYGSISEPISPELEREGILHTPYGYHRVNRQDFSRFQKPFVKGFIAFSAANLLIGGSIVGLGAYSGSEGATWGSMPFFANSVLGLFSLFMVRSFQGITREAHDSLCL
ncbi:hypothetical protein RHABOEDO_001369 [Candidatus Rhabdochlamydia oedothoracis]|uniref:Uncharacterized protein n=1 Tax=Candidatus Rhabdochlamydia oedothoracis TaxID=2720720 RepID=A0ABX8V3M6_9BACT|nr:MULTISPECIES: hypothetical protein [Rhabdochlamydia]KAG6558637.1 hypothetical protein RHOW815_001372 [Candidatus Rhabdochlamydia sp. W815]MCL6756521.1 hypothetical protein [Candidatus Rhabdochlamydia oedothoracis]QYF49102.1 hypothetical protein RHABOEDO_001369 [Candidatus Rhabdochlamydia oedothoracis]